MGPFDALAVACNVVELVDKAIAAAKLCKELYENGSADENNKIEYGVQAMTAANKDLDVALKANISTTPSRAIRLQKIINDTIGATSELKKELNKLKLTKSQGIKAIGGAFKQTLKTLWKRGTIQKLQQQLEALDRSLQSGLLKEL
jgi:hypothetical protein